jgi:glycosyltransferase involved in cell wall biosynthesis
MTPEVTAIVTCMTDGERPFLRETLQSVRGQTVPCETIVVVLESNSWIDPLACEFPNVQVLRRGPGLAGAARNSGVAAATTEHVAFLDGDDAWLPAKIERQLGFLRVGRRDFVAVDHLLMTEEGKAFAYALARNFPMTSSWMVRREIMLSYPFDPDFAVGEDAILGEDGAWWLATWDTVLKFRLPEPLVRYRVRNQSTSTANPTKRRKLRLAELSVLPMARPLLLTATGLLHHLGRRSDYVPHKTWRMPEARINALMRVA